MMEVEEEPVTEEADDADLEEGSARKSRPRRPGLSPAPKEKPATPEEEKQAKKDLAAVKAGGGEKRSLGERDALVAELAERISARLQGMKENNTKKENLAETLTQRIFDRLSKKS